MEKNFLFEEIRKEIKKFSEANKGENTTKETL
jgi:hypothetical protein